jgi:hypothetical protein
MTLAPYLWLTLAALLTCLCMVVMTWTEKQDAEREADQAWTDYLDRH